MRSKPQYALVEMPGDFASTPVYGLTTTQTMHALGGETIYRAVTRAHWLEPAVASPRRYDAGEVAICWQRLRNGEIPCDEKGNLLLG